jgi:hypothetical protein
MGSVCHAQAPIAAAVYRSKCTLRVSDAYTRRLPAAAQIEVSNTLLR